MLVISSHDWCPPVQRSDVTCTPAFIKKPDSRSVWRAAVLNQRTIATHSRDLYVLLLSTLPRQIGKAAGVHAPRDSWVRPRWVKGKDGC